MDLVRFWSSVVLFAVSVKVAPDDELTHGRTLGDDFDVGGNFFDINVNFLFMLRSDVNVNFMNCKCSVDVKSEADVEKNDAVSDQRDRCFTLSAFVIFVSTVVPGVWLHLIQGRAGLQRSDQLYSLPKKNCSQVK